MGQSNTTFDELSQPTIFSTYEELTDVVRILQRHSFDDDNVVYDPFDKTLSFSLSNPNPRSIVDADGKQRPILERFVLHNVQEFSVEVPDDGQPHQIKVIERIDNETYRFVLSVARWIVKISGEPTGELGEVIDETDVVVEFSRASCLAIAIAAVALAGILLWII